MFHICQTSRDGSHVFFRNKHLRNNAILWAIVTSRPRPHKARNSTFFDVTTCYNSMEPAVRTKKHDVCGVTSI
ncbi:jg5584 [Pararge aegeria aegeria]|uniref:Jg5584 protein n=1 Tax=Pararge aegeria aegeria TaxID=348720 RepID=A0A8S4QMU3_9NEOP|nr:jg5584 [Pararge aegeria aegeria]